MKKKIFFIICSLLFITNIKAYENDYFKIDLPESFVEESNENSIYKWINKSNNDQNIVITITNNTIENRYDISKYTENDIKDYEKYLEDEINNELTSYKITVDVKNIKKDKLNNYDILTYDIYWPTKETMNKDIYQKGYTITSNNYILSITYTDTSEITNETDFYKNTINTLEVLDSKIINNSFFSKKINRIIIVGVIGGIIGYIISALKKRK